MQRLFSIEWDERMSVCFEFERMAEGSSRGLFQGIIAMFPEHAYENHVNPGCSSIFEAATSRMGGYIQKFPDWVYNEIYAYNNKHSLISNTKGYGGKTH